MNETRSYIIYARKTNIRMIEPILLLLVETGYDWGIGTKVNISKVVIIFWQQVWLDLLLG